MVEPEQFSCTSKLTIGVMGSWKLLIARDNIAGGIAMFIPLKIKRMTPLCLMPLHCCFFLFFTASDSGADQLNYFWLSVWNTYVFQTSYFSQVALTYVTSRPERTGRPNQGRNRSSSLIIIGQVTESNPSH